MMYAIANAGPGVVPRIAVIEAHDTAALVGEFVEDIVALVGILVGAEQIEGEDPVQTHRQNSE